MKQWRRQVLVLNQKSKETEYFRNCFCYAKFLHHLCIIQHLVHLHVSLALIFEFRSTSCHPSGARNHCRAVTPVTTLLMLIIEHRLELSKSDTESEKTSGAEGVLFCHHRGPWTAEGNAAASPRCKLKLFQTVSDRQETYYANYCNQSKCRRGFTNAIALNYKKTNQTNKDDNNNKNPIT